MLLIRGSGERGKACVRRSRSMHMSMSEFDKQQNTKREDFSSLSTQGLPDDFSDEDLAFAQELDTLFALDEEELPPYFVQTLLDSEESHFQPIEHGVEHKTQARVFRRFILRRLLVFSQRPSLHSLVMVLRSLLCLLVCDSFMY